MPSNLLAKYIWEIDALTDRPQSLEELAKRWRDSPHFDGKELNRKTFFNHRNAIGENLTVDIEYDSKTGKYFISDDSHNLKGRTRQLINIFSVNMAIGDTAKLKGRILYEDIPSGQVFLKTIIEAMKSNRALNLRYKKFTDSETKAVEIEPYVLKIVEQRWYLTGLVDNQIRNYALDRIDSLEATERHFEMPNDFDAETYFEDFYGVYTDASTPVEDIYIRVSETQANYLETLKLHKTQVLTDIDKEKRLFTYKLHLHPTPDFIAQLLRLGRDVEVLSPQSVRKKVADELRAALGNYDD